MFCFKCGDFVCHEIFDQERERIDISRQLPWMGWHDHPVQRSFDSMQFVNTTEHGVVWRGLIASYPSLAPKEHVRVARLSMRRLSVFRGELGTPSLSWRGSKALEFAIRNIARAVCAQPNPVDRYRYSVSPLLTSEGNSSKGEADLQGKPLVTTSILAAAWKTSGMDHLAGYEQRDAPEFLHAFLDTVGKHSGEYRKLIQSMRRKAMPSNTTDEINDYSADIIKTLFEGTLCSV